MKEDFLWPGANVPLLGNGRGVTEGIPEHATKGRHFDSSSSSVAHRHMLRNKQTTVPSPQEHCPQVSGS